MRVETFGLKPTALENVPKRFYDHIMLNGPKRDEQIENLIVTVRNIARAGIPSSATATFRWVYLLGDRDRSGTWHQTLGSGRHPGLASRRGRRRAIGARVGWHLPRSVIRYHAEDARWCLL